MDNTAALGSSSIDALALFGKTAVALLLVLGVILLSAWLVKRFSLLRPNALAAPRLRVLATTAVGPRERVVIVAFDNTQLVLGVSAGQVTKLAELPNSTTDFAVTLAARSQPHSDAL
jgi:flagellar protein FliO/FliZ